MSVYQQNLLILEALKKLFSNSLITLHSKVTTGFSNIFI